MQVSSSAAQDATQNVAMVSATSNSANAGVVEESKVEESKAMLIEVDQEEAKSAPIQEASSSGQPVQTVQEVQQEISAF